MQKTRVSNVDLLRETKSAAANAVNELEERLTKKIDEIKDKSFLVCPDCAQDGGEVHPLYWVNADQLSFGDYVEVRAEARCKECDSYWQIKIPQMVRAQPQNRLSAIGVF